jgi:hypothetical protein
MADIITEEKIPFYDEAKELAERTRGTIESAVVLLRGDGRLDLTVVPIPRPDKLPRDVLTAAKRHPGMAVGIILEDNGKLKVLPDPLPIPEAPSS